jgi:hypothetical protein
MVSNGHGAVEPRTGILGVTSKKKWDDPLVLGSEGAK